MLVTQYNDVKVYNLSAGKSLPQFVEEAVKKKQSLRYNEDFRRRIDLIQDLEFNIASSRVKCSTDGEYICATGVYPPEMRLYETRELGMKCSRGFDAEVVDFTFLSQDWKKLVFLLDDRNLEFHSQYGRHHRLRIPKVGRDLCYDTESCTLFVGGSSPEVVRVDLEGGAFLTPVAMKRLEEVHGVSANPVLPVISCAGDGGLVESYDLRDTSKPLQSLQVSTSADGDEKDVHVTSCAWSHDGMHFAAGTAGGIVRVYDVRSSKPLAERDHRNSFPIKTVTFHRKSAGVGTSDLLVGSADTKSIKVWEAMTGDLAASVESKATINSLTMVPDTGLMFTANDQARVGIYFVPALGLAPRWCSFLDSMTEELEESKEKTVFDDYMFVTNEQLEQLGASELIGTKFLQPYMHGFFMDSRLHGKLKAALDPFAFEEYRKDQVRKKLEAKRTMRTRVKRKVDVNAELHRKLQEQVEEGKEEGISKKRREAAGKAQALLSEDRFKALFADPDFAIDAEGPGAEQAAAAAKGAAARSQALRGKKRGR